MNAMTHTFHIAKSRWILMGLAAVAAFVILPVAAAHADKSEPEIKGRLDRYPTISVMLGKAEMVEVGENVADILVANPSVIDVTAVRSNRLYLVGASLGETNIMALDEAGNILKRINIHVQMDVEKLEDMISDLYPNEDVNIRALTDQVVLTGEVSTPSVANRISNLVAQYAAEIQGVDAGSVDQIVTNMLNVRGEQQVMLRVKIVEAARNSLKDLGIETEYQDTSGNIGVGLAAASALGLSSPVQLGVMALNYTTGGFGPLSFLVRALEEEGILNTLAEPNLTAISGEQAGFLAGGEFPIPTQLDDNGNLIYEFRPFGVSLNFRPVVLSENRISLELTTEVSSATFDQNLQLQGISVPTFNVRRAQTTVEMGSGGTLMIAGLLESNSVAGLTQLPGIGDVPVLGDLVKSDTFSRDESELVIMITPYLVQPFAQNNAAERIPAPPRPGAPDVPMAPAPAPAPAPEPAREHSQLGSIFGNNIRRTYGTAAPEKIMKEVGTFGYMTY